MEEIPVAGPSRPRTPPPLPAKDGAASTPTPRSRRKSWFSFGTSSPAPNTAAWATSTPSAGAVGNESPRRASSSSLRKSEEVRLLEDSGAAPVAEVKTEEEKEELSTDGDLEASLKKKKKKRRSKAEEEGEEGEIMQMQDLGKRKGSLEGLIPPDQASSARVSSPTRYCSMQMLKPQSSQDDSLRTSTSSRSRSKATPLVTPRSSSITQYTTPLIQVDHPDKPQPPIPVERPLPPLPPSTSISTLPIPDSIVVIPSSPRKLVKQRSASSSRTELATIKGEPRSRSRDSSRTGTPRNLSRSASPIGLGLPQHVGAGDRNAEPPPPPVPSKSRTVISVSSPQPSRPTSPSRVGFVESATGVDGVGTEGAAAITEDRKARQKRATSFAGLRSKSTSGPPSTTSFPDDDVEALEDHKPSMLEWLGVKKSAKRRTSEAKLSQDPAPSPEEERNSSGGHTPRPPIATLADNGTSRESLQVHEEPRSSGSSDLRRPSRPELRTEVSSNTVVPHSSRIASLFARRASSKEPVADDSGHSTPSQAQAIPHTLQPRSIASSSTSSMVLPPLGVPSPDFFSGSAPWMSSPTTESDGEEKLFSAGEGSSWGPGKRPWMEFQPAPHRSNTGSPLSSQETTGTMAPPPAPILVKREGRVRSFSDAPTPPPSLGKHQRDSSPHRQPNVLSKSLQPSPITPARPKMGSRTNSGNSAIIDRMKTVFAKSATSRTRSNSAASSTTPPSQITEFGSMRERASTLGSARMQSTSSSSSITAPLSGRIGPNASLLDLIEGERRLFINEDLQNSPRSSFADTFSSFNTGSTGNNAPNNSRTTASNRPRASTVSFTTPPALPLPPHLTSPGLHPITGTSPKRRPSAIARLSTGLFAGPSSPKRGDSLFPLPPRSSGSMSSGVTGFGNEEGAALGLLSPVASPRPSTGSLIASSTPSAEVKKAAVIREGEETPDVWLEKVVKTIGRNDIAGVLASSGDEFHTEALKLYMSQFDFTHTALDVALRKLLMQMSLPKETQQIDRVIEAFANRYEMCEPGLFEAKDNTYVLAFSMMMLHTDAFNRHNKNKMTKADYVRNTRLDGVPPIVLEAFYDNIVFTPFVFIEDDADLMRASLDANASPLALTPTMGATSVTKTKIDVYHMIVRGLLPTLRVDVQASIPAESPFSCLGTRPFLEMDSLHRAFTQAHTLQIALSSSKRKGAAAMVIPDTAAGKHSVGDDVVLKITKVGLISRKDEFVEGGRKAASKKWKNMSVILTGSQLVFFKDPLWALTLIEQIRTAAARPTEQLLPRTTSFKPEEVYSLKDCIAVFDRGFSPIHNTFRLIMPHGHQYLIQAGDEYEMNEWIGLINYAATFKTAGIRMRAGSMDKDQAVLAGAAAAASHKRELEDLQYPSMASRKTFSGDGGYPFDDSAPDPPPSGDITPLHLSSMTPEELPRPSSSFTGPASLGLGDGTMLDVAGANDVAEEDGERLEEVFDVVKAELAAGRGGATTLPSASEPERNGEGRKRGLSKTQASRADAINAQVRHIQARISPLDRQLQNHLRLARNLAILTPFQKSTRERIASQLPALARNVRNDRLLLAKYRLYMTVLIKDAERDTREWARVRHVALQAANRSLRDPKGVRAVVEDVNAESGKVIPALSLPPLSPVENTNGTASSPLPISPISPILREDSPRLSNDTRRDAASPTSDGAMSGTSPGELPVMMRRPSQEPSSRPSMNRHTSTGSMRSRSSSSLAYRTPGISRRSTGDLLAAGHEGKRDTEDEGSPSNQGTPLLFALSDAEEPAESKIRARRSHSPAAHKEANEREENKDAKEEAEDWQRTKAAKRVRLASTGEHGHWSRMSSAHDGEVKNKDDEAHESS